MIKKNDLIRLEITGVTADGSGVAKYEGLAVFVEQSAPGDVIDALVLKVKKTYAFAKVINIISPSSDRVEPDCPSFSKCGGCVYRHIDYEAEKRIKQKRVSDAFERIAGEKVIVNDIIGSEEQRCYRNKIQLPFGVSDGKVVTGFFSPRSHRLIDSSCCVLHPQIFHELTDVVTDWANEFQIPVYNEIQHSGLLRHLYIRSSSDCGEIMLCLVVNGSFIPKAEELWQRLAPVGATGLVMNVNKSKTNVILGEKCVTLAGKGYITDDLLGLKFNISPLAFYQINHSQTEKLYRKAAEYADVDRNTYLLDMYCGVGTIGLTMAARAKKLTGVEIVPQAVDDAEINAEANGINNAEFICADAAQAASILAARGEKPDVIVLDPPRKGCDPSLIDVVCSMDPQRIVYVSCDPATLARDYALFVKKGYVCPIINSRHTITPVDMFPGTKHVETVVRLSRQ